MKHSIWLTLLFFSLAFIPLAGAQPITEDSSPIVATHTGGYLTLSEFEDWLDYFDLMYPVPDTQYADRAGWEEEIIKLAEGRTKVLWRNSNISELQQPTDIKMENDRVEVLKQRYAIKNLFKPTFDQKYFQWQYSLSDHYEKVKGEQYTEPSVYEFRHIFVNTNPEQEGRPEEEALERVEAVHEQLAKGASFIELAKQYSDSASERRGALLGPVPADQLSEDFSEALATLEEGQVSEPFKTKHGYELVKLVKKHPQTFIPFSQVRKEIEKEIPPPDYRLGIDNYLAENDIPMDVYFPLKEEKLEEYDKDYVLFRVGKKEYSLGEMYDYFEQRPRQLENIMPLNFNPEDLNFERFVGLAFFVPKPFHGWILKELQNEKILASGRHEGLFEKPEFKEFQRYFKEETISKLLVTFHTPERMREFDEEGHIEVKEEALQPFIDKYLAERGISF